MPDPGQLKLVKVGDQVEVVYTVAIGNDGPSAAQAVRITRTLPLSVTSAQPLIESIDWLPPNTIYTTTLIGEAAADISDNWPMSASFAVTAITPDPLIDDNEAAVVGTAHTRTDLWTRVYVEPTANLNLFKTYVLFGNYGPSDAHGVWVHDVLPPGVTAQESTSRHFDILSPNVDYGWYMILTLGDGAGSGQTLTDQVYITGLDVDPFTENNSAMAVLVSPYRMFLPLIWLGSSD